MCLKIRCDGESEKFCKFFWTKQGLIQTANISVVNFGENRIWVNICPCSSTVLVGLGLVYQIFFDFDTVALSFLFDKHYPIMDQLGLKDSSRDLQVNCTISYLFLSTFNVPYMCRKIWCDVESYKVLSFWVYVNKALGLKSSRTLNHQTIVPKWAVCFGWAGFGWIWSPCPSASKQPMLQTSYTVQDQTFAQCHFFC